MSASSTRTSAIVRSFGIRAFVMPTAAARREPRRIEQRQIHRRLAVDDPVRDVTTSGGRVLEAVATEADGEEKAADAGRPADDRVVIGRQRTQARPAAGDRRL